MLLIMTNARKYCCSILTGLFLLVVVILPDRYSSGASFYKSGRECQRYISLNGSFASYYFSRKGEDYFLLGAVPGESVYDPVNGRSPDSQLTEGAKSSPSKEKRNGVAVRFEDPITGSEREKIEKMVPYLLSWAFSNFLDHKHAMNGITCKECHGTFLPKDVKVAGKCQGCHGSYTEVAALTKKASLNPHESHFGVIKCELCHKTHEESSLYCNECHLFNVKVP